MKKHMIAWLLLAVLALFAACGKKDAVISTEKAQKIALQELGLTAAEVDDVHVHATQYEDAPCYEVHITDGEEEFYVYVDQTGKVLNEEK